MPLGFFLPQPALELCRDSEGWQLRRCDRSSQGVVELTAKRMSEGAMIQTQDWKLRGYLIAAITCEKPPGNSVTAVPQLRKYTCLYLKEPQIQNEKIKQIACGDLGFLQTLKAQKLASTMKRWTLFNVQDKEYLQIFLKHCFRALCCKGPPPARPEYDLVCIGLTGSGKTSLLSKLCSESPDSVVSTTGFSIKAVPFQNAILNVKELGGADNIRKYWSRYYQGSQGVIFVLDSASSEDDLETARNELHSALQHPQLCTLPFLILANHQDKPAARSVQEVKFCSFRIRENAFSLPRSTEQYFDTVTKNEAYFPTLIEIIAFCA
ncbi:hypothetical protein E5288_WYG012760 [Bos mutus]|uniref:ADP-ribosylation factor-like protein 15 n=1 Tax=Bos mutus TaxID=72004 RepID=A0A6B0QXZ1_9CETA|nr:hypothetical protein [Bos mutus]